MARENHVDNENTPVLGESSAAWGNPDQHPVSIRGWTLKRTRRGYYEARKRINGRLESVYLGKRWERAFEILPEEEAASPVTAGVRELETPTIQAEQVTEHEEQNAGPDETVSREGLPCRNGEFCRFHDESHCWFDMRRVCVAPAARRIEPPKARTGAGRWGGC